MNNDMATKANGANEQLRILIWSLERGRIGEDGFPDQWVMPHLIALSDAIEDGDKPDPKLMEEFREKFFKAIEDLKDWERNAFAEDLSEFQYDGDDEEERKKHRQEQWWWYVLED